MYQFTKNIFEVKEGAFSSCGIMHEKEEKEQKEHSHDFIEIIYILNGKAEQYINKTKFKVSRGDLLFVNYGSVHSYVPQGKLEYMNIGFKPEALIDKINDKNAFMFMLLTDFNEVRKNDEKLFRFSGKERVEIENLLEIMRIEAKDKKKRSDFIIENCFNSLIAMIMDKCLLNFDEQSTWEDLVWYIRDNLGEKLTLEELAKKCYYNPSYFSRVFKERFGVNVLQYIKEKRIEFAKELLCEGNTIEYVIEKSGFSSKHRFYSAFLETTGKTVSEFVKENR